MHSLIITAHPSSKGFVHQIASTYQKTKKKSNNTAEIINLYDKKYKQDFLSYETFDDLTSKKDKVRNSIQNKITKADELIFTFPLWWGHEPAILKNFIDCNFMADFAFRYEKNGPAGLLKGKTAKIYVTCDAPAFFYKYLLMNPLKKLWKTGTLGFCGIKVTEVTYLDKKRKRSKEYLDNWLEKLKKSI